MTMTMTMAMRNINKGWWVRVGGSLGPKGDVDWDIIEKGTWQIRIDHYIDKQ